VIVGGSSAPKSSGVGVGEGSVKTSWVGVAVGVGVRVWTLLEGWVDVREG
jgi:hypothetical protein